MYQHQLFNSVTPSVLRRFKKYHLENPNVYKLFRKYANEALSSGRTHFGAQMIIERIRWFVVIETRGDEFKINNDYASCYSRLLMIEEPSFGCMFRIRDNTKSQMSYES